MSTPAALAADQASAAAEDWTFRTADTKQVSHGIHPYPAMMIPQVARRLTEHYGSEGGLLFDPYCGSGTALLEGMLAGMAAIGTDLNPLARLIARVKTRPVNIVSLDREIFRFRGTGAFSDAPVPPLPNIDYWFSASVQRDLAAIRQHIDAIHNAAVADAFRLAFSLQFARRHGRGIPNSSCTAFLSVKSPSTIPTRAESWGKHSKKSDRHCRHSGTLRPMAARFRRCTSSTLFPACQPQSSRKGPWTSW